MVIRPCGQRSRGARRALEILALGVALLEIGCRAPVPSDEPSAGTKPSVLLVTFPSLRPDTTGRFGTESSATPEYDRFAEQSDWAGTAVASSSAPVIALRSLMTGTSAWQHQTLTQSRLDRPRYPATLAVALGEQGYRAAAVVPSTANLERYLLVDGFASITSYQPRQGLSADLFTDLLAGTGPLFVWVHLPEPNLPLEPLPASDQQDSRKKVTGQDLLPFADPVIELPTDLEARTRTLYREEARRADTMLGTLFDFIRQHEATHLDEFVTIVTAGVGFELGEHSQVMYAQNLNRASLEVPLALRLPSGRQFRFSKNDRYAVAQTRVWATLVELAGGQAPPRVEPSLLRSHDGSAVVSQLFRRNGENLFSLVREDRQLIVRRRYAPPHERFYRAQLESASNRTPRSSRHILALDLSHFRQQLPFSGGDLNLELFRWNLDGSTERLKDPETSASMARELRSRVLLFSELERTPEEESRRLKQSLETPLSQADK